jgi:hypothetical protein
MNRSVACAAALALAVAAMMGPRQARADGSDVAAGLFGGLLAGAIVGSALAPRPAPIYVAPEPYYPEPVCFGRRQVWDSYYGVHRWQRVRVPCY